MKTLLLLSFIFSLTSLSFGSKEHKLILKTLAKKYKGDSTTLAIRFNNKMLIADFENAQNKRYSQVMEANKRDILSVLNVIDSDTFTVVIQGYRFYYTDIVRPLYKKANKSIRLKEFKGDKMSSPNQLQFSIPLISSNGQKAIVYIAKHSKNHCSSGGIVFLSKSKNNWIIDNYKLTWIA